MKFRITLFLIISGIFIPINSANANSNNRDDYNFYKGSFSSICAGYAMDFISEKNASMMLNSIVKMGNKDIVDLNFKKKFNNIVNSKLSTKNGCSKLVN
jgi:hypothetical protein